MTYAWLMAPHEYEPDYDQYMLDLDLLENSMANVATYDDWFPDHPTVARQRCGVRHIGTIAHVDHGKTAPATAILRAAGL